MRCQTCHSVHTWLMRRRSPSGQTWESARCERTRLQRIENTLDGRWNKKRCLDEVGRAAAKAREVRAGGLCEPSLPYPASIACVEAGDGCVTPEELSAMQTEWTRKVRIAVKGLAGKDGLFERAMRLHDSLKDSDPVIKKLPTAADVRGGAFLLGSVLWRQTLVEAWALNNACENAAELDELLRKLATYCDRIAEDRAMCKLRRDANSTR